MLQLRPSCECCDRALGPDSPDARICSFECTFCESCAESLQGKCPNCGGELVPRPRRPAAKLAAYPASIVKVHKPASCAKRKQPAA
ncbi:MAG TPA: DUF1272 domain-containing protein [Burkholderiales bacterium]|nr:DUF1272 domain-containing protein [Burkholderiales bacterium]